MKESKDTTVPARRLRKDLELPLRTLVNYKYRKLASFFAVDGEETEMEVRTGTVQPCAFAEVLQTVSKNLDRKLF